MAPALYRNQSYRKIVKELEKSGELFSDPEFPAAKSSLFLDPNKEIFGAVDWKRPGEIVNTPRLFVDGVSKDDVNQGAVGDCWFVAACSAITHRKSFMNKVIPDLESQEWDDKKEKYKGIFRFNFWRWGEWTEVVVDDLLPVQSGKLLFAHSKTPNEFWCALLEKAFAKLSGSYESLIGGSLSEALMDMSGGVPENLTLTDDKYRKWDERSKLFDSIKHSFDHKSLLAAAIVAETKEDVEDRLTNGLVKGHSYAVTMVKQLELDAKNQGLMNLFTQNEKIMMVRLHNPWGAKEWNGPWSDGSAEWDQVTEDQKKDLGLVFNEDGEFWITWEDFCNNFTHISVCHLYNTSFWTFCKQYAEWSATGEWKTGKEGKGRPTDRAGGCLNFKATAMYNPQYRFDITNETDTVILALTQKDIRQRRKSPEMFYMTIGLTIMRMEENRIYRVHSIMPQIGTSAYSNRRSEYLRLDNVKKGRYLILPTTFAAGEEGEFFLRVYTSSNAYIKELTEDYPKGGCCSCWCCKLSIQCVTRIKILSAKGLKNLKTGATKVDAYCYLKCEKETAKTDWVGQTSTPKWDTWFIFYRSYHAKPITIELYDANYLRDSFLGKVVLAGNVSNDSKHMEIQLENKEGAKVGGILSLEISTYDDPMYL